MSDICLRCGGEAVNREFVLECKRCRFMWAPEGESHRMEYNEEAVAYTLSSNGWKIVPEGCLAIFGERDI